MKAKRVINIFSVQNIQLIHFILMVILIVATFQFAIQNKMNRVLPEAILLRSWSISAAISHLKHGLNGYVGYKAIHQALEENGMTNRPDILANFSQKYSENFSNLQDADLLNNAIQKALSVENPETSGIHTLASEDLGLIDYYSLSFLLFGYNIQGFLYLYFLILIILCMSFFWQFKDNNIALTILNLYLVSHYLVVSTAPLLGIQLYTVHNNRFMSVLAILPVLYLALSVIFPRKISIDTLPGIILQVAVFLLVLKVRSTVAVWVVFLGILGLSVSLVIWRQSWGDARKIIFRKVSRRILPIALAFIAILIMKISLQFSLHSEYKTGQSIPRHLFWHNVYLGFAIHPELKEPLGLIGRGDRDAFEAAKPFLPEGEFKWKTYDEVIFSLVLKTLKNYPTQFIQTFFILKPKAFIDTYFSSEYNIANKLFSIPSILIIIFLSLTTQMAIRAKKISWNQILIVFGLILAMMPFALIPALVYLPAAPTLSDPALILTMSISYSIYTTILFGFKIGKKI